jgi:uncharacterized membrane protein SirB2
MIHLYLIIHLIGFGLLASVVFITPVLESSLRKTENYSDALRLLKVSTRIGILSPVAVVVMLASGIGLMTMYDYGIFSHGWLTGKLLIFLVMLLNGGYSSVNISKKRREIYEELAAGKDNPRLPGDLLRMHNRQSQYVRLQAVFLLMILIFTVYKPGL